LRGPISWTDLSEKWHDALPGVKVEQMLGLAQELEDVEDVTELTGAFA
jgi:hypothetical protein